ncbi:MAG TPA: class I SAM-dependent methyltransferase [Acidimicrobiia bacterium]|nr:class I SAM-dependent methyltransferase [Acidimicrobiia bacterium]
MLTVDFDRLDLRDRQTLLDLGCGGGRHAFEAMRRGAVVVALDADAAELKDASAVAGGMVDAGELPHGPAGGMVNGDALTLPFPDESFDRVIAAEVLEHIPDDERALGELVRVLRPGGRMAVTVPTRWPERVCWALDHRYHDTPGGHVRIYHQPELEAKVLRAGLVLRGSHHAHALHSPYWMLKCAVGVDNADALPVRKYHDFLVWELTNRPRWARVLDRTLNPVLGKSLVVYTEKLP